MFSCKHVFVLGAKVLDHGSMVQSVQPAHGSSGAPDSHPGQPSDAGPRAAPEMGIRGGIARAEADESTPAYRARPLDGRESPSPPPPELFPRCSARSGCPLPLRCPPPPRCPAHSPDWPPRVRAGRRQRDRNNETAWTRRKRLR